MTLDSGTPYLFSLEWWCGQGRNLLLPSPLITCHRCATWPWGHGRRKTCPAPSLESIGAGPGCGGCRYAGTEGLSPGEPALPPVCWVVEWTERDTLIPSSSLSMACNRTGPGVMGWEKWPSPSETLWEVGPAPLLRTG